MPADQIENFKVLFGDAEALSQWRTWGCLLGAALAFLGALGLTNENTTGLGLGALVSGIVLAAFSCRSKN